MQVNPLVRGTAARSSAPTVDILVAVMTCPKGEPARVAVEEILARLHKNPQARPHRGEAITEHAKGLD